MYTDTLLASEAPLQGNTRGQIFMTRFGYLRFVPFTKKGDANLAMPEVLKEVEVPTEIYTDNKRESNLGCWKEICKRHS